VIDIIFWANMSVATFFIGLVFLAGGGFLGFKTITYNNNTYPELYNNWLKM